MEAAVSSGGMRDHEFAIDPRLLRGTPRGRRADFDVAAIETDELPIMLGALFDINAKSPLPRYEWAETKEITSRPALRRRRDVGGIGDAKAFAFRGQREKGD